MAASFEMDPLYEAGDEPKVVLPIEVPAISLHELKEITKKFGPKTFIGKGSFGAVYHALLSNGREAAIKKLYANNQSEDEFLAKVSMASRLKHENFIELLGYCVAGNKRVLAYEFASNGSLHDILHGKKGVKRAESGPILSFAQRVKIAVEVAKGLEYLHKKADPKIFHGNLNSSNVLLFDDDVAKIADFNLSNETVDSTSYDYAMTSVKNDDKTDVYNFGVILLELLTGHKPVDHRAPRKQKNLVTWVIPNIDRGSVTECIDARLEDEYSLRHVERMAMLARMCVQEEPALRPNMTLMVKALQPLLNSELGEGFELYPLYEAEVPVISLDELKETTKNFGPETFIGTGSFGTVYHGLLSNGREAAIKKLDGNDQPEYEFLMQISMAYMLKHENFVELLGYCIEGNQRVIAYEFASNGSLHDALHGKEGVNREEPGPVLSWAQRVKIAAGIAKGLEYLHTIADPKIFHGKLNSRNVLLFDDDVAKIADFDLSNKIVDTKSWNYNFFSQKIDDRADVYSFGVILLELLTGHDQKNLVEWAIPKINEDRVVEWIDARLEGRYPFRRVKKMAVLAGMCVQEEPVVRPCMSTMVEALQPLLDAELDEGFEMDPYKVKAPVITLDELKETTKNFGPETFIGKGSFGTVYHALLYNGTEAAIKKLEANDQLEEFLSQISMAYMLKHENFVQLLGYCVEGNQRVIAYEFASNGSLHAALHGKEGANREEPGPVLSWIQRVKIAVGIAKGLEYLHKKADPKIFHGNLNSSNVLLFDDDVAKIADFDLSNEIVDTTSYDYEMTSLKLEDRSDIYSFGVILLELLTGRKPVDHSVPREQKNLVEWVIPKIGEDKVAECIDPRLEGEYPLVHATKVAALAGLCVQEEPGFRPNISFMVAGLEPLLL